MRKHEPYRWAKPGSKFVTRDVPEAATGPETCNEEWVTAEECGGRDRGQARDPARGSAQPWKGDAFRLNVKSSDQTRWQERRLKYQPCYDDNGPYYVWLSTGETNTASRTGVLTCVGPRLSTLCRKRRLYSDAWLRRSKVQTLWIRFQGTVWSSCPYDSWSLFHTHAAPSSHRMSASSSQFPPSHPLLRFPAPRQFPVIKDVHSQPSHNAVLPVIC